MIIKAFYFLSKLKINIKIIKIKIRIVEIINPNLINIFYKDFLIQVPVLNIYLQFKIMKTIILTILVILPVVFAEKQIETQHLFLRHNIFSTLSNLATPTNAMTSL